MSDWDIWFNTPNKKNKDKKDWAIAYDKQFIDEVENDR